MKPPAIAYIALLRAVNVGGTGKLPMSELKAFCEQAGLRQVQTYIASGNVVFSSERGAAEIRQALQARLEAYAGKPVGVLLRTQAELARVLAENPFPDAPPNRTMAIFLDAAPPPDALERVSGRQDEVLALGRREIYVHYGAGMASSKLRIPAAQAGTARNMNTIAKLVELAAQR